VKGGIMLRRTFIKSLALPFFVPAVNIFGSSKPQKKEISVVFQESVVAGYQYYDGKNIWNRLSINDSLRLKREPKNPYDSKAVEVYWKSAKLGYIPRLENVNVSHLIDRGEKLSAKIAELQKSDNPWKRVKVAVLLDV
tara:strand:- start:30 stop:443 length:414 start_codon:yes stop_codon:yes gene_type:complete